MTSADAPAYLAIGRIGRAHGVQGEVRVEILTDFPEARFVPGATVLIGLGDVGDVIPTSIVSVRPHQASLLVRFAASEDRDAGRQLTGKYVFVPRQDARTLDPDEFYLHELVGVEVVTVDGEIVGRVTSTIETGSADVVVIRGPLKEHLVPLIRDVIDSVDLAAGRMTIRPIPGLLE